MSMDNSVEQFFDSKRMELRSELEEDCFCPNGRTNWIHYTACPGGVGNNHGAGIKDRQKILRMVMWYADELCAKIALTCTPEVWLSEKHGCFAPPSARWDAYFTLIRKTSNGTISTAKDILHWDVNETVFEGLEEVKKKTSIVGYEIGRKLYSEGTPFVWQFDVNIWKTDLSFDCKFWKTDFWRSDLEYPYEKIPQQIISHRKYSATCGPVDLYASEELLNVAQFLSQELNVRHSNDFVTLHLRRGDNKDCDTEIETVVKYLKCSIGGDNMLKVLVLTNGEKLYLKNLQEAFSEAFPQWEMISVDQLIESKSFVEKLHKSNILSSHVGDAFLNDNCFRWEAERMLTSISKHHLERGRKNCKQCYRGGAAMPGVKRNETPMILT